MNVTVIGGGNIGTLISAQLGAKDSINVKLYTSKPEKWCNSIKVYDENMNFKFSGKIKLITNDLKEAVNDADVILITLPKFLLKDILLQMPHYVKRGAFIGVVPGTGGSEFCISGLKEMGCTFFGLQRVPGISRIIEYGHSVMMKGSRKQQFLSAIPKSNVGRCCEIAEDFFGLPCFSLNNYLEVTLTPSNPILHTTRLWAMFHKYPIDHVFDYNILFYEEWDDSASEMMIRCDKELHSITKKINLNLNRVVPLTDYYESDTAEELTKKIKSITAFKGILSPMARTENGYIIDVESRYFKEDFPFGINIIKAFALITDTKTPYIDRVVSWGQKILNKQYFTDEGLLGKDADELLIPQNFDIHTVEDIVSHYNTDFS